MRSRVSIVALAAVFLLAPVAAQQFEFYPGAKYDPAIPTLKQVVGHGWGENITLHHEMERFVHALAGASPKLRVVRMGETWEGKSLYYLIITSEANHARLDQVKAGMKQLADPRRTSEAEAKRLMASLPPVTWLAYGVHGNEISSPDAALLMAYHLVASQNDPLVQEILEKTIVILDPMQNPDGRDRFIHHFRQSVGRWPDADPQAAEHNELWPSGRMNHYLFDMNRDWFAMTQRETQARVRAYQDWYPVVFVDLHEMGSNSTYYFAPPALPLNPNVPQAQRDMWTLYGKNNGAWFDRFRFDYFTREVFDSFYPGYGEGWPLFQGSVGMTYENASVRGVVVRRDDGTDYEYRQSVQKHFVASLATAETTARNREALLRYFYNYRKAAVEEGQKEATKEFILPPGRDPNRVIKMVRLLQQQGVEVQRADAAFSNGKVRDSAKNELQAKEFPAGTFVISLAQPTKRLIKTLLDKHTPMDEGFLQEQIRRRNKRLGDEIYDVTAWSLPLLYGVECYPAEQVSSGQLTTLKDPPAWVGGVHGGPAKLVYLIPWGTNSAARALADLLRQKVRVHMSDRSFTLGGRKFPAGSLIVKTRDNPDDLHARLVRAAADHGVDVYPSDSAWIEEGVNLGSNFVRYLEPPRIALAWNIPTSPLSAGWTRYVLEQLYGLPVTIIHAQQLGNADLAKYNVLILPHGGFFGGGYGGVLGENGARRIRDWIQAGGTLITFAEATRWLTEERVGLLATQRELRGGRPEREERPAGQPAAAPPPAGPPAAGTVRPAPPAAEEQKPAPTAKDEFDVEKHILPDREPPDPTPGAIFRVRLDGEHWLAFGYDGEAYALVQSSNIFTPLKLDRGRNVALYLPSSEALASGFTYEAARKQLGNKAYLMHQPTGRGHVVAFAEDPNYRAFLEGLNILFLNGVFFGPAH